MRKVSVCHHLVPTLEVEKRISGMEPCPFPTLRPSLYPPFSSLHFPCLPGFFALPFVSLSIQKVPGQIYLRSLWERCEPPHSRAGRNTVLLVHIELIITLSLIVLSHKFSDNHTCITICIGPVTCQYGVSKNVGGMV